MTCASVSTNLSRSLFGTFTILNPTISEVNAALAGLQITDSWSSGVGSFNNSAFDYQIDVNYTSTGTTVPEPGTLGMVGGALIGLGATRRWFKRSQLFQRWRP